MEVPQNPSQPMPQGDPGAMAQMFQSGPDPTEQLKGVAEIAKQIMGSLGAFDQVPELAEEAKVMRQASMSILNKLIMRISQGSQQANPMPY